MFLREELARFGVQWKPCWKAMLREMMVTTDAAHGGGGGGASFLAGEN